MKLNLESIHNVGALTFLAGWAMWRFADFPSGMIIQFIGLVLMIPLWIYRTYRWCNIRKYPEEERKNIRFTGLLSALLLIFIILYFVGIFINRI